MLCDFPILRNVYGIRNSNPNPNPNLNPSPNPNMNLGGAGRSGYEILRDILIGDGNEDPAPFRVWDGDGK